LEKLAMKKTLIALAVLTVSGASFAQSSVTISGRMDATLRHTAKVAPGAANLALTEDGAANTVRFAVTEDLGGGLKAVADLGMRFGIADGNAQAAGARPLFQGESRVGITGGFGTFKFGRGLTALQLPNGGNSDPWGVRTNAGSVYAAGFASDYAAGGEGRIDGALFYTSPSISGLTVSVSMSPKKLTSVTAPVATSTTQTAGGDPLVTAAVPGVTSTKTHQSISAVYTAGPLVAGLGHEQNRVGDTITQVFGNYNMGVAKLFASYATIEGGTAADRAGVTFAAASSAVNSGSMAPTAVGGVAANGEIKNWTVGATVPMGATTILVGYSGWNGNGSVGQKDDTKFGIGAKYDLSKRTFLQASYATQTRKNNTGTRPDRDNTKQNTIDLGIAHSF
jgi:predicted porin